MSSIWTIRRSATDVKLTGLCGGVAQHWGIDPVLVRVGWALLALSGGIGVVLYVAGWLLIPVEGSDKALVDDLFGESVRRWPKELWITLVVVASLALIAMLMAGTDSVGRRWRASPMMPLGCGTRTCETSSEFTKGRRAKVAHLNEAKNVCH